MSAVVAIDDRVWRVHPDPPFSVAGLILSALRVDEQGYRIFDTMRLVWVLVDLAAEDDRDPLAAWLLETDRMVPDSTLAEAMIYAVEHLTGRRFGVARTLIAVALVDWHLWRGRFMLRGIAKPNDMSLVDVVDALYALLFEDAERRGVKPLEIPDKLDQMLADQWLDRELWGTDVAVEAMMVPAPQLPRRT